MSGYGARVGRERAPARDQFLTSAMLCVGAVSVLLVSVMIAGGLAFVGLSESRDRDRGMEYVNRGSDAWTSAGGFRAGDAEGGERLFASHGGRYDYFAQPERLDQEKLVDELDKRYGERLEGMMRAMQSGEGGYVLASAFRRGEDPSYLPPAPMTEAERKLNAQAEEERRNAEQRLPSVTADIEEDEDDEDATTRFERDAYAAAKTPSDVVKKARERFEEYENTLEWHEKIREDADNYIERLSEIRAILSKGYHKSARKQIELGVEAVRQWHTTIAKDLHTKTSAMEVALEKIATAKAEDESVHVNVLKRDIEDELEALTTTSARVSDLYHAVHKIVDTLSSTSTLSEHPSNDVESRERGRNRDSSKKSDDDDETYDIEPESHDHAGAMKHWKRVADEWVESKTKVVPNTGPSAPWTRSSAYAALGSAAPDAYPSTTLNEALQKIIAVMRNVTETFGAKIVKGLNSSLVDGDITTTSVSMNFTNFALDDVFNVSVVVKHGVFGGEAAPNENPAADLGADAQRLPSLGMPAPQKTFAKLGSSWGPNQWVGTDAEDATWDPMYGADADASVRVDTIPASRPVEEQTLRASKGEDGSTRYEYTPTPEEEDFESASEREAAKSFASAEHKSAEAWRAEAKKAQEKLAELASKGVVDSEKTEQSAERAEELKETLSEFKKALVREADARSKAEKELRDFKIRAADEQEETERRVVEQAKLQILAARAEARDASLARIKAEAEAEKIAKEKAKLARAAAKVQESAEKALESLVASNGATIAPVTKLTIDADDDDDVEDSDQYEDVDAVASAATDDADDVKATADDDAVVNAKASTSVKGSDSSIPSSWDLAADQVEHEAASNGGASSKPAARESRDDEDDVADDVDDLLPRSKSASSRAFTTTFGIKNASKLKRSEIELLRDAALSLLSARASGACDDRRVSTAIRTASSGVLELDVVCDDVSSHRARAEARAALDWAFESDRFARNLRALGFERADDVFLARATDD